MTNEAHGVSDIKANRVEIQLRVQQLLSRKVFTFLTESPSFREGMNGVEVSILVDYCQEIFYNAS